MQTLQRRPEIDRNWRPEGHNRYKSMAAQAGTEQGLQPDWRPEDHGRNHPRNVRMGVILQELLDRTSAQRQASTPPSPPLYRHVELVTEAGYSSLGAMRAIAERNNGRRCAGGVDSVHDWHHWRRNRYLGFDEVLPQARPEPYIGAVPTEGVEDVRHEYQPAEYDDSIERYTGSPIPELDRTGVFRRLGQSMLVAVARASHTVSAAFRL